MKLTRAKALVNVTAFLSDDKEIVRIINGCFLNNTDDWRIWKNSESKYLKITQTKKLQVKLQDPLLIKSEDLYRYCHPGRVSQISKKVLIVVKQHKAYFLFIGNDDKFRFAGWEENWYRDTPLILSLDVLRVPLLYEDVEKEGEVPLSSADGQGWISPWPPSKKFLENIEKENTLCSNLVESLIEDFYAM